jgi:hypothetical protein
MSHLPFASPRDIDSLFSSSARRVRRRRSGASNGVLTALIAQGLLYLLGGWALMLTAPLLHRVLGTPFVAPGLWPCLGLILLAGVIRIPFSSNSG